MRPRLRMFVMGVIQSAALTVFLGIIGVPTASAAEGTPAVSPAPAPNRALPRVESFKAGLAFPAEPGPEDIFRARVFEEPLVPVGGEPSSAENAALAVALLGYGKRSGPDDFSGLTGFLEEHPRS